jgi:mRNA interferase RelE/StbE
LHEIQFLPSAARQLAALPEDARRDVAEAIDGLQVDPRPMGVDTLTGFSPRIYRIRVRSYRVLYQIEEGRLLVTVVRVADRREAYNRAILARLRQSLRRD